MRTIGFALAALSILASPVTAADPARPINLECVHDADYVEIKVVGEPSVTEDYDFELKVASQGRGGVTNTVQRGSNRIGGAGGILLHSRIRTSDLKGWTATLHVTGGAGEYTVSRSN